MNTRRLAEKNPKPYKQAHAWQQMISILLEAYYCEGPVHLLDAIVIFMHAYIKLAVLCGPSQLFVARIHKADVLFALYELYDDWVSLEQSIASYQHLLRSNTGAHVSSKQRTYIEARLAYALSSRYRAVGDEKDCHLAWTLLRNIHVTTADYIGCAWMTTAMALVIGLPVFRWVILVKLEGSDWMTTLEELRNGRMKVVSRSLYVRSLVAESYIVNYGVLLTGHDDHLFPAIENVKTGLQTHICSNNGDVLRYQLLLSLHRLHRRAYLFAKDRKSFTTHLGRGLKCINDSGGIDGLLSRNHFEQWLSRHRGALPEYGCEVFDLLEQSADTLKTVIEMCPHPRYEKHRAQMMIDLTSIMGRCFDQSGNIGILDDQIDFMKTIIPSHLHSIMFLACNVAEALLLRAQVTDRTTANILVNHAIEICLYRKESPDFDRFREEEDIVVNWHLMAASKMQTQLGVRPCLEATAMLRFARQRPGRGLRHHTPSYVAIIQTQTEILISRAYLERDPKYLMDALLLIEEGLIDLEVISSIYVADLMAAKADLLIAWTNFEDGDSYQFHDRAWKSYERAALVTTRRPTVRFQSCLRWADRAEKSGNLPMAVRAYMYAVKIIPHLVFHGDTVVGRIDALRQVNGLATSSVAAALNMGDTSTAINLLERTRGILWLQSSHGRSRYSDVNSLPTHLRVRFQRLDHELEASSQLGRSTSRRRADEMGSLLSEIRKISGFERVLLPPSLPDIQLKLQSNDGYAVVIVPNDFYCDVILLGMDQKHASHCHIRVSTMRARRISEISRVLGTLCSIGRAAEDGRARGISQVSRPELPDPFIPFLSELWNNLVYPIMEHLNIMRVTDHASRKRIWWCPIGALSSIPLHAAGIYEGPAQDHVGNYAISSYVPTIATLYRLLTDVPIQSTQSANRRMLLIAQPATNGLAPLAHVATEINQIKGVVPPEYSVNLDEGQHTLVGDALDGMKLASIVHFACHGHHDRISPLDSGFELQDGRLTLRQLMHLKNPKAQLAYLSACNVAGMDESRPDECLNLVGSMIFMGFRSVVGTMWAMDDLDGPFMAKHIYSRIFRDGKLDLDAVPYAVDKAVRLLRETGVPASRWATYVHFGV